MIEDCQSFENLSEKEAMAKTQENICQLYQALFDLKKKQRLSHGEDGEILEYAKAANNVYLPDRGIILPREKPIPKPKPLTKWEKFRLEKGMSAKEKRSRMVYDPITNDWVPRYGMNSIKKIEDKYNWVMEEKPKHREAGMDPFTFKRAEKKLEKEKQDLRELKNKVVSSGPAGSGQGAASSSMDRILDSNDVTRKEGEKAKQPSNELKLKARQDVERDKLRKRERKALMKSL